MTSDPDGYAGQQDLYPPQGDHKEDGITDREPQKGYGKYLGA